MQKHLPRSPGPGAMGCFPFSPPRRVVPERREAAPAPAPARRSIGPCGPLRVARCALCAARCCALARTGPAWPMACKDSRGHTQHSGRALQHQSPTANAQQGPERHPAPLWELTGQTFPSAPRPLSHPIARASPPTNHPATNVRQHLTPGSGMEARAHRAVNQQDGVCMPAGGEQRGHPAAPGSQMKMKWAGRREGPLASEIDSFSHGRSAQTRSRQLDPKGAREEPGRVRAGTGPRASPRAPPRQ
jgi:hypothetical protein